MKKIVTFIYLFLLIVFLKLVITFTINEIFISRYNKGDYEKGLVKSLFVLNFSERYIAYYNYGNLLYQIGYYEDAIKEYNKALELEVPEKRVCYVRINLSLAMINTVNDEMEYEEQLKILEGAREVLYEDDCADPNDESGKSDESEQLEEEIKEQEEQKKEQQEEKEENKSDKSEEEKEEEEKKHDELEDRNESANGSREEELDRMDDYDNYEYYDGKKW